MRISSGNKTSFPNNMVNWKLKPTHRKHISIRIKSKLLITKEQVFLNIHNSTHFLKYDLYPLSMFSKNILKITWILLNCVYLDSKMKNILLNTELVFFHFYQYYPHQ